MGAGTTRNRRSAGAGNGGGLGPQPLDPNTAIVVVAAWLLGALAMSAAWTERAEISG